MRPQCRTGYVVTSDRSNIQISRPVRCGCFRRIRSSLPSVPGRYRTYPQTHLLHASLRLDPPQMPPGRSNSPTETLGDYSRTEAGPLTPQISNGSSMSAPYFSPRQPHRGLRVESGSNNSLRSLNVSHGDRVAHGHTLSTSSNGAVSGSTTGQTTTRPSGPRHIASATLRPERQTRSASDTTAVRGEGSSGGGSGGGNGNGDAEREQVREGKASGTLTHRASRSGLSTRTSRSGRATPHTTGHSSTHPNGGTPHLPSSSARVRLLPYLPHSKDSEVAATVQMYWSKAPVWGTMPNHGMRAHSVTLVDSVAWIFGGCDERGCWKDLWLFNTGACLGSCPRVFSWLTEDFLETMQWSHPDVQGDVPPPCRAHTATLVDRKIVIFGGGEGPVYYDTVYVLDTVHRRWQKVEFPPDAPHPTTRRAHTAVYYDGKIWVFGGGNGSQALNDVWTLTANCPVEKMKWAKVEIQGNKQPSARGYHTANLVRNIMIVVGGSDGRECFSDIWCLNLGKLCIVLLQMLEQEYS